VKIRIRPVVVIALVTVLLLALFTGNTLIWRLLLLCAIMTVSGYLWVRFGLSGMEIQTSPLLPAYHAGQEVDTSVVVNNASPLPKFMVKVSQRGGLPGYNRRLAINLPAGGSFDWHTTARCSRRGRYELWPPSMEISDPFGIFKMEKKTSETRTVTVYPKVKELTMTDVSSRAVASANNRHFKSGSGEDISNVREYTAGDSLSRVHWRSTAHHGRLMVKDFAIDRSRSIWIVLDMFRKPDRNSSTDLETEAAVSVAASLAKYYLEKGNSLGFITEGDSGHILLPRPGEEHYWCLMNALAVLKPEGYLPADELLVREHGRFKANSLVLVVSCSANEKLIGRLHQMNRKGLTALLIVPDTGTEANSRDINDFYVRLASSGIPAYIAA
jgi:uncharacterized protein (DUF58 family)